MTSTPGDEGANLLDLPKELQEIIFRHVFDHDGIFITTRPNMNQINVRLYRVVLRQILSSLPSYYYEETQSDALRVCQALKEVSQEAFDAVTGRALWLDALDMIDPSIVPQVMITQLTPDFLSKIKDLTLRQYWNGVWPVVGIPASHSMPNLEKIDLNVIPFARFDGHERDPRNPPTSLPEGVVNWIRSRTINDIDLVPLVGGVLSISEVVRQLPRAIPKTISLQEGCMGGLVCVEWTIVESQTPGEDATVTLRCIKFRMVQESGECKTVFTVDV